MTAIFVDQAIEALRADFRGELVAPGSPGYEETRRVRNGLIDRHPAVIARCSGTADVVAAVNFAREHDLLVSVRGGGHNVAGTATNDGGLVIDLSPMRGVRVDPAATHRPRPGRRHLGRRRPRDPALRAGHAGRRRLLDRRRRADPARRLGLAAAQVRLLRRQPRSRSTSSPPTARCARPARPRTRTSSGRSAGPAATSGSSPPSSSGCTRSGRSSPSPPPSTRWRTPNGSSRPGATSWTRLPTRSVPTLFLWSVPAAEAFPAELHDRAIVVPAAVYAGPAAEGERVLRPLRELATPLLDLSGTMPYAVLQGAFDAFFPKGWLYYWKSLYLDRLRRGDDRRRSSATPRDRPSPMSLMALWHLGGGAASRVGAEATAFGRRGRALPAQLRHDLDGPGGHRARASPGRARPGPTCAGFGSGGLYLNFAGFGEEKEALVRAGYGANYERLVDAQDAVRPEQPLPHEPEHPAACVTTDRSRGGRSRVALVGPPSRLEARCLILSVWNTLVQHPLQGRARRRRQPQPGRPHGWACRRWRGSRRRVRPRSRSRRRENRGSPTRTPRSADRGVCRDRGAG